MSTVSRISTEPATTEVPERSGPLAIVTDSTASLTADLVSSHGVTVVPLQVVIGGSSYDEGPGGEVTPERLAQALSEWTPVSTSRPNPDRVLAAYQALAERGVREIVSVHLSAELSGTVDAAQLAAGRSPVPVTVVDTRQVGMGTGFAVLSAAEALAAGADAAGVAEAARRRAREATSLFYVDTLEHLRRGGRMGAAAALLGSALAVKPILKVVDGQVEPFERVRTASKALARLGELAIAAAHGDDVDPLPGKVGSPATAGGGSGAPVDVAVAHLASPDRARQLAELLADRLADELEGREVLVGEIGAVLGAHVGPGMVSVTVSPRGRARPAATTAESTGHHPRLDGPEPTTERDT